MFLGGGLLHLVLAAVQTAIAGAVVCHLTVSEQLILAT